MSQSESKAVANSLGSTQQQLAAAPVRVLVVDDSALMRQLLTEMLNSAPDIEVIGTAQDAYKARDKIKQLNPDVVTLDVEMPGMDGITFLANLMRLRPMPVVMISTLTEKGAATTIRAMELGAISCVHKPSVDVMNSMQEYAEDIVWEVRNAAAVAPELRIRKSRHTGLTTDGHVVVNEPPLTCVTDKLASGPLSSLVVAIGASTGGTEAVREVLIAMPANGPGIVITQHIPAGFSKSFANRMNDITNLTVAEATDGAEIRDGTCFIAPGDQHLEVERKGGGWICRLSDGPRVSYHKPSVDVLFKSVARNAGSRAIGVILTGMGRDGANGMLEMRREGAYTIAQNEETCVVYGMPRAAIEDGAVDEVLALENVAARTQNLIASRKLAK